MWLVTKLGENQDFDLTIRLLQFIGLWSPPKNSRKTTLDRLREGGIVLTLMFGALNCTIFLPLGALVSSNDFDAMVECILVASLEIITVAKVGCLFFGAEKLKELTSNVVASRRQDMGDHPSEEKQKIVAIIQRWINAFVALTFAVSLQYELAVVAIVPSMAANRKYLCRFWFPIDPYSSPTYEIVFALFMLTLAIAVTANNCVDGLLAATLMQLVGQFRLLRHDLAHIKEDAVKNVRQRRGQQDAVDYESREELLESGQKAVRTLEVKALELDVVNVEDKEVTEEMTHILAGCVSRYQMTVRFVHEVEALFAPLIWAEIVVTVIALLAVIFFAEIDTIASESIIDAVYIEKRRLDHQNLAMQVTVAVGALYLELGFLCYMTDLITEESELVRSAVYECDWLASTESFKKSMMIVMSRANQPVYVRAAGYIPMTHETFLGITKLAYSYYTALSAAVHKHDEKREI